MEQLISALGSTAYIDSNIVIYIVEGFPAFQPALHALLKGVDDDRLRLVTSELTLAEVLVKPIANNNIMIQQAYRSFLESSPQLTMIPVTRTILESAAAIRAEKGVKLPDAIHIATAQQSACSAFLSNDRLIPSNIDIPIVQIQELAELIK